jgi:hypothetical protein
MDYNKDLIEAARQSWNLISSACDKTPKLYHNYEEFEKFYADILRSLLSEEEGH